MQGDQAAPPGPLPFDLPRSFTEAQGVEDFDDDPLAELEGELPELEPEPVLPLSLLPVSALRVELDPGVVAFWLEVVFELDPIAPPWP